MRLSVPRLSLNEGNTPFRIELDDHGLLPLHPAFVLMTRRQTLTLDGRSGVVAWVTVTVKTIATEVQSPKFTEIKAVYVAFQPDAPFQWPTLAGKFPQSSVEKRLTL